MTMHNARIMVALIGIVLPYAARLPRGAAWFSQYTEGGLGGFLLLSAFNAVAWGSILALSFMYLRSASLFVAAAFGFAFLAWAHFSLDLASDAQAAVALVFIPVYALLPIAIGGAIGYLVDRQLRRHEGP